MAKRKKSDRKRIRQKNQQDRAPKTGPRGLDVGPVASAEAAIAQTSQDSIVEDVDQNDPQLEGPRESEAFDYDIPDNNLGRVLHFSDDIVIDSDESAVFVTVKIFNDEETDVEIIYPGFDQFNVNNEADLPDLGERKIRIVGFSEQKDGFIQYRTVLENWRKNFVAEQARVEEKNDQYLPGDRIEGVALIRNTAKRAYDPFFVDHERDGKKERLYIQSGALSIPDLSDPTALTSRYTIQVLSYDKTILEGDDSVALYKAMIVEKTDPAGNGVRYDAETLKRQLHAKKDLDRLQQIQKLPRKKRDLPDLNRITSSDHIDFQLFIGLKIDPLHGYFIHRENQKSLAVRSLLNLLDPISGERLESMKSAEVVVLSELNHTIDDRPVFEGVFQHDVEFIGYVRSYEDMLNKHQGVLQYIDTLTSDAVEGQELLRSIQKKRSVVMDIVSTMGKGMRSAAMLQGFLNDFRSAVIALGIDLDTAERNYNAQISTVEAASHHEDDLFLFELGAYERRHPRPSVDSMHKDRLEAYKALIDNEVQRKPGTYSEYEALKAEIAQRNHDSDMGRHGRIRGLLAWAKAYADRFPSMFSTEGREERTVSEAERLFTEKGFDTAIDQGFEDGTIIFVHIPGFGYQLNGRMLRPGYLEITFFDDASRKMQATPYFNGIPAEQPIIFSYDSLSVFGQILNATEAEVLTVEPIAEPTTPKNEDGMGTGAASFGLADGGDSDAVIDLPLSLPSSEHATAELRRKNEQALADGREALTQYIEQVLSRQSHSLESGRPEIVPVVIRELSRVFQNHPYSYLFKEAVKGTPNTLFSDVVMLAVRKELPIDLRDNRFIVEIRDSEDDTTDYECVIKEGFMASEDTERINFNELSLRFVHSFVARELKSFYGLTPRSNVEIPLQFNPTNAIAELQKLLSQEDWELVQRELTTGDAAVHFVDFAVHFVDLLIEYVRSQLPLSYTTRGYEQHLTGIENVDGGGYLFHISSGKVENTFDRLLPNRVFRVIPTRSDVVIQTKGIVQLQDVQTALALDAGLQDRLNAREGFLNDVVSVILSYMKPEHQSQHARNVEFTSKDIIDDLRFLGCQFNDADFEQIRISIARLLSRSTELGSSVALSPGVIIIRDPQSEDRFAIGIHRFNDDNDDHEEWSDQDSTAITNIVPISVQAAVNRDADFQVRHGSDELEDVSNGKNASERAQERKRAVVARFNHLIESGGSITPDTVKQVIGSVPGMEIIQPYQNVAFIVRALSGEMWLIPTTRGFTSNSQLRDYFAVEQGVVSSMATIAGLIEPAVVTMASSPGGGVTKRSVGRVRVVTR